jgi:hypothetical protein
VSETVTASRAELAQAARRFPAARVMLVGAVLAAVGGLAFIWGLATHPDRAWWAYHVSFVYTIAISQALVVFAAVQKLVKGRWANMLARFGEAAVGYQVVAIVLYLGLYIGREHIFTWLHEPRADLGWWLTSPAFFVRNGLILAGLAWLSWRFVRRDVEPDERGLLDGRPAHLDAEQERLLARDAAILVVAFAFGYTLLAYDLMMSLAHKWVSNLFGAFYFIGGFLGALAMLAVLGIAFRGPMGIAPLIAGKTLHDLGKLIFGFTVFWTYLMWSQFLVIWYGNLPEETWFVFYRLYGPWKPVGVAVFLLVFLAPFAGLLFVRTKKFPPTLVAFSLISLTGLWLERYLEVVPSVNHGAGPAIGLLEIGVLLFFAGLWALAYGWFAGRYPMVSPRLAARTLAADHH